ncbi:hypothetical protein HEB94_005129 [Actinopolymorpha pittospori]|uniref:Uncharacterized protein n=1 Tax=Actinopolymorpha pittospori TaxID=648752 RepID=A0A927RKI2_9ACTN|nr:hypothetical protein [Actinopolymorpha pittospori]
MPSAFTMPYGRSWSCAVNEHTTFGFVPDFHGWDGRYA